MKVTSAYLCFILLARHTIICTILFRELFTEHLSVIRSVLQSFHYNEMLMTSTIHTYIHIRIIIKSK